MKELRTICSTATGNIAGLVLATVSAPARQHGRYPVYETKMKLNIYIFSVLLLLLSVSSALACVGPMGMRPIGPKTQDEWIGDPFFRGIDVPPGSCLYATGCGEEDLLMSRDAFELIFNRPDVFCKPHDSSDLRNSFLISNGLLIGFILLMLLGVFIGVRRILIKLWHRITPGST